jgi:hypothetical protein
MLQRLPHSRKLFDLSPFGLVSVECCQEEAQSAFQNLRTDANHLQLRPYFRQKYWP